MVVVAQLVRALDCGSRCRGFESHLPPPKLKSAWLIEVKHSCFIYTYPHAASMPHVQHLYLFSRPTDGEDQQLRALLSETIGAAPKVSITDTPQSRLYSYPTERSVSEMELRRELLTRLIPWGRTTHSAFYLPASSATAEITQRRLRPRRHAHNDGAAARAGTPLRSLGGDDRPHRSGYGRRHTLQRELYAPHRAPPRALP